MSADLYADLEARFDPLSLEEKLRLIEWLMRRVRLGHATDHAAFERDVLEMANDQDFLRAAGMDNEPRLTPN
jgi:hypothetical protein